jgi:hypothetical protein
MKGNPLARIALAKLPCLVLITPLAAVLLAGCGGSSGGAVTAPKVGAARVFTLGGFTPAGAVRAGHPTTVSFTVKLPSGQPLTHYKTGGGPHTGVHLIIVRNDLAYIIHKHPPIAANGVLRQSVTFPAPGPYRVLVDIYPDIPGAGPNFQLFTNIRVSGAYHPKPLPKFSAEQTIDGYHFTMQGQPHLKAIQAQFVNIKVTDPRGRKVTFVPWFGALAHAIFFHQGSLDYFHTHVCAPSAPNCSSVLGAARIAGTASAPGNLRLGVLLPVAGTWRLFVQLRQGTKILTAPFTLKVS